MAETSPRDIVIGLILFGLAITAGFFVFSSMFVSNGVVADAELSDNFKQFNESLESETRDLENQALDAGSGSILSDTADVFVKAINVISSLLSSPATALKAIGFIQGESYFKIIPDFIFDYIGTILIIIILLVIVSVWWRYKT